MKKIFLLALPFFVVLLFLFMAVPAPAPIHTIHTIHTNIINPEVASSQGTTSRHVVIFSACTGATESIFVPVNSTGLQVYPIFHVRLYGVGHFNWAVNGSLVESGYSLGTFNFTYPFTLPVGGDTHATLTFGSATYSFNDITTGELTNQIIETAQVSSYYPGQPQFLTVADGVSGALMYPHWEVTLRSTQNVSYSIFLNSQQLLVGHVLGKKVLEFNVSSNSATVTIGLGKKIFKYPNELISSVPVQKYYGPKPPPLAYTLSQYEFGIARAFVASAFAIIIALFTARKYLLEKERREVIGI
ncbi:MAG: hypothetical protein ACYCSO_05160 [Cuniculiplasma sp.]